MKKMNKNIFKIMSFLLCTSAAQVHGSAIMTNLGEESDPVKRLALENFAGSFDPQNQDEYYKKLIEIRKNGVPNSAKANELETLTFLAQGFRQVKTSQDQLNERAALNLATTLMKIFRVVEKQGNGVRVPHVCQEAYCLFTLLVQRANNKNVKNAALKNATTLLDKKVIKEPLVEAPHKNFTLNTSDFDAEKAGQLVGMFEKKSPFNEALLEVLSEQFGQKLNLDECLETWREMAETSCNTPADYEKLEQAKTSAPKVDVNEETFRKLNDLNSSLNTLFYETTVLEGRKVVGVFFGRALSWVVKLRQKLKDAGKEGFPFLHVLGSGLHTYNPSESEKRGYKNYLDSFGFEKLSSTHEIVFMDVVESGKSLHVMYKLFEELYPNLVGNIQAIGLLNGSETVHIPSTRCLSVNDDLKDLLFSKHSEKQVYCPYPSFYPHDWNKEKYIDSFEVPKEAKEIEGNLEQWVNRNLKK